MEMSFDQPGQDRAPSGVDARGLGLDGRRAGGRAGIRDASVADHHRRVGHGRRAGAVDQLAAVDERGSWSRFHGVHSCVVAVACLRGTHASCTGYGTSLVCNTLTQLGSVYLSP